MYIKEGRKGRGMRTTTAEMGWVDALVLGRKVNACCGRTKKKKKRSPSLCCTTQIISHMQSDCYHSCWSRFLLGLLGASPSPHSSTCHLPSLIPPFVIPSYLTNQLDITETKDTTDRRIYNRRFIWVEGTRNKKRARFKTHTTRTLYQQAQAGYRYPLCLPISKRSRQPS